MVSRRRMRRMVVVPCFATALVFVAFFKDTITDALSSSPLASASSFITVKTVTVVVEQPQTLLNEPEPTYNDAGQKRGRGLGKPTRQHIFRANGLMEVSTDGRHPLFELIERGEAKWDVKRERQSKTLQEAVREYKRRHKRTPPKGFDHWWYWCEKHNVQLPDEYDQIYRDLEPFWGIDPVDLKLMQSQHESHLDSYTIGKDHIADPLSLLKVSFSYHGEGTPDKAHQSQAWEMIDTLKEVQEFIPPFRAVFSPHDNPNLFTDWEVRTQMVKAAAVRKYVDVSKLPEVKLNGWLAACDPKSPARQTPFNLDQPPPPQKKKSFIYDHVKAMDPCQHPTLLHHSGQYLAFNEGPIPDQLLIPQFSYSSTPMHHDIVPATPINWVEDTNEDEDVPWEEKDEERLLWRGTSTGMWHDDGTRWRTQQRIRLVDMANARAGTVSILPPRATRDERVGEPEEWKKARANPAMMDVVFAGEPNSCAEATCAIMKAEYRFSGEMMGQAEAGLYKYVFDTDGHGWSSRFKRLMVSRSLIFKSTVYPEWFAGRLQEYVHYIPIQLDYSDLYDVLAFFRGDLNGDNGHDDLAEKIASAGREWAKTYWRREDLTAYMFRLMLEYSRLMSLDREAASYKDPDASDDWD